MVPSDCPDCADSTLHLTSPRAARNQRRTAARVIALVLVVTAGMLSATPASSQPSAVIASRLPSPILGPGVPDLERSEERRISKALNLLARGRIDKASARAKRAGDNAAAWLLRLQLDLLEDRGDPSTGLALLVQSHPDYAAASLTHSIAAETKGDEVTAYSAALHAAELWPASVATGRAAELMRRWVEERIGRAVETMQSGQSQQALTELEMALALEPDHRDALLGKARALTDLDRTDEAEEVLLAIPDDAEALMLAGQIAESKGDWLQAMERYRALPGDTPGREAALRRAQLEWRLSVLPASVQDALASQQLSRTELAVLLVALVPQLEAIGGGQVPLLSDIVDLPSQREIVTLVRLQLLTIDPLEHRFFPDRPVMPEDAHVAIDRIASLLGLPVPPWCDDATVVSSSCIQFAEPVSGEKVAAVVLRMVHGEDP